jgi:hypothetical protein
MLDMICDENELFYIPNYLRQGPIKFRMLIKMDSEVLIGASLLWVDLIVFHQNIRHL